MDERDRKSSPPNHLEPPTIDIGVPIDLETRALPQTAEPPAASSAKTGTASVSLDRGSSQTSTRTQVDMGEDLLESTVNTTALESGTPMPGERRAPPLASSDHRRSTVGDLDEALENAKILAQEGFFDDAKKILRRILLRDSHHISARKRLEEIQEQEIKTLLNSKESPRIPVRWRREKDAVVVDPEEVLRRLDQDLGLGLTLTASGTAGQYAGEVASSLLFKKREDLLAYQEQIVQSVKRKPVAAQMDLGIAYMEMELYEIALALFESAVEKSGREADRPELGAQVLSAEARLRMGQAFEVIFALDPVITNAEIPREKKVEPYYLLARAQQLLAREEEALRLYRIVVGIVPHYRDADERIRMLLERKLLSQ